MVVIGSGPNGLVAANMLARRGFRVLVLEANPRRAGGALGSDALTLPGFVHDVGGGFFPFGRSSPAFQALDLPGAGVEWLHGRYESCHPALDGEETRELIDEISATLHELLELEPEAAELLRGRTLARSFH